MLESGGTRLETHAGTVALFEPDAPQHYQTNPKSTHWHLVWTHFQTRPAWIAWLDWPSPSRGFRVAEIPDGGYVRLPKNWQSGVFPLYPGWPSRAQKGAVAVSLNTLREIAHHAGV